MFDIGGTLIDEAPSGTPTHHLTAQPRRGAVDALAQLHGRVRIGAVTNTAIMGAAEVRRLLTSCGIAAYLEHIVTTADVGVDKPDPAALLVACELFGIGPSNAVYVGNVDTDREAAMAGGMSYVDVNDLW